MTVDGLRGRYRAHVQQEIKAAALGQLAVGGAQAISLNAIAKQLGVSGPALHRYYPRRDDLITALVLDAYADLHEAVAGPASATRGPQQRLRAFARALREFALAQPYRYGLLFTPPVPGYDSNAAPLVAAAQEVMDLLVELMEAIEPSYPDVRTVAVLCWSRIHGIVTLDLAQVYAAMGVDAARLVDLEVDSLIAELTSRRPPS